MNLRKTIVLLLILAGTLHSYAQVDREFWFVVPRITNEISATSPASQLTITAHDLPARVLIEMPAEPAFVPFTVIVGAYKTEVVDITANIPLLENAFITSLGIPGKNNKGLHIVSDNYINVTFESSRTINFESFSLKGRNALGSDFFTPFQNDLQNMNNAGWLIPGYSAFDVVFTENNTSLRMVIPPGKAIYNGAGAPLTGTVTIGPFNRGQTYTGIPAWINNLEVKAKLAGEVFGRSADDHLTGVRLTTVGGQKIAVTIKDDAVKSLVGTSNYDLLGDQIIPVSLIGKQYFALRGQLTSGSLATDYYTAPPGPANVLQERLYIVGTVNNTDIYINDVLVTTINAGQTYVHSITADFTKISSPSQKFYCLQVTGFGNELADEILPPTDICTGSTQVGFTRMPSNNFQLGMLVRTSAVDSFLLNGATSTLFPKSSFFEIANTPWSYYRNVSVSTALIPIQTPVILSNTKDVFHVFVLNGASASTSGARLSVPTNFSTPVVEGFMSPSGSLDKNICYGDTVQLVAHGGSYFSWLPAEFLTDRYSPVPVAKPEVNTTYIATVNGACGISDTVRFRIRVALPMEARFNFDTAFGCSPFNVQIRDQSIGVKKYQWDFGDASGFTHFTTEAHINDSILNHSYTNPLNVLQTRQVRLIVENTFLCRDTLDRTLTIYPRVIPGFTQSPGLTGCQPFTVTFTNSSVNANKYRWDFGDKGSSSITSPSHTFYNSGVTDSVRIVKLVAISPFYCSDSTTRNFTIRPQIKANFTAGPDEGCSPHLVSITNSSTSGSPIASYSWIFGDGSTDNTSSNSLSHTYIDTTAGVLQRNLKLVIVNTQGCSDSLTRLITVFPEVSAQFTQNQAAGCNPLPVNFTGPVNKMPVGYAWNFGEGTSSSSANPAHSFINHTGKDTTYTTRLIVTSPNFCRDTFSRPVTVRAYIDAQFSINRDDGCQEFDVQITNNSLSYTGISGYQWIFGDGTANGSSSAPVFSHTYSNAGPALVTYPLRMVVRNLANCTDTMMLPVKVFPQVIAQFTADLDRGCTPLQVSFTNTSNAPVASIYEWTFGDSTSASSTSSIHTFSNPSPRDTVFRVLLHAASGLACADTQTMNIHVYSSVDAAFALPDPDGCSPFLLMPSNQSSGGITQYSWDFRDGSATDTRSSPDHSYRNQGLSVSTHDVKLVVRNIHGCSDSITHQAAVYPEVVASFAPDKLNGCTPLTVNFANSSNAVATDFNWAFGNQATSGLTNPSHTFGNLGPADSLYAVLLHAQSVFGCTDDTVINITSYAFIDADFKFEDPDVCSDFAVLMSDLSLGGVVDYSWDFDGNGSYDSNIDSSEFHQAYINTSPSPVQNFVKLRVKNNHTCYDSIVRPITVYPRVTADFIFDSAGCSPHASSFTNTSLNGNMLLGTAGDYFWNFGDTVVATLDAPQKIWYNYADYDTTTTIKLIASSEWFCMDSVEKTVYIYHKPRARFLVDRVVDCPPFDLNITNTSFSTTSTYRWNFGDGNTDTTYNKEPLSNTYLNAGQGVLEYTIRMSAITTSGCADSTSLPVSVYPEVRAEFLFDSTHCSPYLASFTDQSVNAIIYDWDFGDGNTSSLANPMNRFVNLGSADQNFDVRLLVRSVYDCWDTVVHTLTVFGQPDAEFTPSPTHLVYAPEPVITFTNNSNNQPDWDYLWDFDDGSSSTNAAAVFQKTYTHWAPNADNNQFDITLLAINRLHTQCADTSVHSIRIYPPVPEVKILNESEAGCEPFVVQFEMESNYAYADSFKWDFGDGSQSTEPDPEHTYIFNGIYNVRLEAIGDGGPSYTFTNVTVYPKPITDFDLTPRLILLPDDQLTTINKSKHDVEWLWDFGDGSTSTLREPQYTYSDTGFYSVTLTTFTDQGCSDTLIKDRIIEVQLPAKIEFPNAFTPNINGPSGGWYANLTEHAVNDVFYPLHKGVMEYNLEIYTRWGEKLFETSDIGQGWDGYYNGKLCKQAVYVWKARGKFINGRPFFLSGDVTLLYKN
jgi:PKD repeat protein